MLLNGSSLVSDGCFLLKKLKIVKKYKKKGCGGGKM